MTTINLRDGLEALYYFGEQDFDPQRNQLQDHSGYGRHASANGGPTVGVNGPNDFEAASCDGNDDYFRTNTKFDSPEFTVHFLVKWEATINSGSYLYSDEHNSSGGSRIRGGTGDLVFEIINDTGSSVEVTIPPNLFDFKWAGVTAVYDGSEIAIYADGTNINRKSANYNNSVSEMNIFHRKKGNRLVTGDLAVAARYSRGLSDVEIEALNDLTAPRRSQL